jgi:hypothetical protein
MEKQKLPNATIVLILGILSIPACCLYGVGLILGIVAIVIGKKDFAAYKLNPDGYEGYGTLKTGRILAIIGIVLNVLFLAMIIFVIAFFGFEVLNNQELLQQKLNELSQQQ